MLNNLQAIASLKSNDIYKSIFIIINRYRVKLNEVITIQIHIYILHGGNKLYIYIYFFCLRIFIRICIYVYIIYFKLILLGREIN